MAGASIGRSPSLLGSARALESPCQRVRDCSSLPDFGSVLTLKAGHDWNDFASFLKGISHWCEDSCIIYCLEDGCHNPLTAKVPYRKCSREGIHERARVSRPVADSAFAYFTSRDIASGLSSYGATVIKLHKLPRINIIFHISAVCLCNLLRLAGSAIRSFTSLELVPFSRWSGLVLPTEYSLRIATLSN